MHYADHRRLSGAAGFVVNSSSAVQQVAEEVAVLLDAGQHLVEASAARAPALLGALLDLLPGPRGRDVRRALPRREYGLIVVLAPVFCDQSRKTLPGRAAPWSSSR